MPIQEHVINNFPNGTIDTVESKDIPEGAASKSLNWVTRGDRIELRPGQTVIGTETKTAGKISGLHTAYRADNTAVVFRKNGQKLEYFIVGTSTDWQESGTNLFGAAAANDDASFANYTTSAGNQVLVSSPNSGLFKIMSANPGSPVNLSDATKNFSGQFRLKISQNRMLAWGRPTDKTGEYGSYIDAQIYTTVSGEAYGTGDGSTKTFAHTLASISGKRTAFRISVTDGNETFTDNYSGVLTGNKGGSGTVNYATGAVSVTFNTAPTNTTPITTSYQWEDSTNNGIADFTKSSPRTAGQGFIFRQDEDGLDLQNSFSYNGHEYSFHKLRTWDLNITDTDTNASNLPYRSRVGISNWRGGVAASTGVYYINDLDKSNIKLERLTLNRYGTSVIPEILSKQVTKDGLTFGVVLDAYSFDQAVMFEYGDFILCAFRTADSTVNNRVLAFNKLTNAIDYWDYTVNCFAIVGTELWAGDSISPNVYKILSGYDDNNSTIPNSWEGKASLLGDNLYLKRVRRLVLQGVIAVNQSYDVYGAPDNGDYVYIGTISGSGSYVDRGQLVSVNVGYGSVGSNDIGGNSNTVNGYNYEHKLKLPFSRFVQVKLMFVAKGIGYVSVSRIRWFDVILLRLKILKKYS